MKYQAAVSSGMEDTNSQAKEKTSQPLVLPTTSIFTTAFKLTSAECPAPTPQVQQLVTKMSHSGYHSWDSLVSHWDKHHKAKGKVLQARHATEGRSQKLYSDLTPPLGLRWSHMGFPAKAATSVSRAPGVLSELVQLLEKALLFS